jgi:hypothetical protein
MLILHVLRKRKQRKRIRELRQGSRNEKGGESIAPSLRNFQRLQLHLLSNTGTIDKCLQATALSKLSFVGNKTTPEVASGQHMIQKHEIVHPTLWLLCQVARQTPSMPVMNDFVHNRQDKHRCTPDTFNASNE